jgi:cytochrome b
MPNQFIWPPAVRIGHWALVTATAAAWFSRHTPGGWHEWFGYAVLTIVASRTAAGFLSGPPFAFSSFVVSPANTLLYVRTLRSGKTAPSAGHNPLGGWMVLTLLTLLVIVCFTGWLYTTDRFWGVEWVETLHSVTSDILLAGVALHVSGVLFASWHEQRNLIGAMIHGRKEL